MFRFCISLSLSFLCCASAADAQNACADLFTASIQAKYEFQPVLGKILPQYSTGLSNADHYLISRGGAGGSVVRVVPLAPTERSYIRKTYRELEEATHDRKALRVLKDLLKNENSFKVVTVLEQKGNVLLLEDVRGQTVDELLHNAQLVSKTDRKRIIEEFKKHLTALHQQLMNHPHVEALLHERKDNELGTEGPVLRFIYIEPGTFAPLRFYIRSDQVVLSPYGTMTIVDPF